MHGIQHAGFLNRCFTQIATIVLHLRRQINIPVQQEWSHGPMDKAPVYGTGDSRFDPWCDRQSFCTFEDRAAFLRLRSRRRRAAEPRPGPAPARVSLPARRPPRFDPWCDRQAFCTFEDAAFLRGFARNDAEPPSPGRAPCGHKGSSSRPCPRWHGWRLVLARRGGGRPAVATVGFFGVG